MFFLLGAVDISTFPPLNVNWTFGGGGGGDKAVDVSEGAFLDKSKLMHFHKLYFMCGTALVT